MTTYATLVADIESWSARSDITAKIPTMVALFESRVNRTLRVRQMEASFTGTIANNVIPLPSGWLEFKRLWVVGYESHTLYPQSLERVVIDTEGVPNYYATDGSNVRFNGTGDIAGVYYTAIPSLYTQGTNWLSVLAYDAYLFGVLAEVATYQRDMEALQAHYARASAALESVSGSDTRLRGPLVARAA